MNIRLSLILFVLLLANAPLASAQISNGSFDDFTGYTDIGLFSELGLVLADNLGSASSWQGGGIAVRGINLDNAAAWLGSDRSGLDDSTSQVFSLSSTGSYSFGWDSFAERSQFETEYRYNVDLSEVGGASIYNNDFSENAIDELATSHSVPFNATDGLYTVTFTSLGSQSPGIFAAGDIFIDNVTVAAVPEPGSALLATLAGLGLLLYRRR